MICIKKFENHFIHILSKMDPSIATLAAGGIVALSIWWFQRDRTFSISSEERKDDVIRKDLRHLRENNREIQKRVDELIRNSKSHK